MSAAGEIMLGTVPARYGPVAVAKIEDHLGLPKAAELKLVECPADPQTSLVYLAMPGRARLGGHSRIRYTVWLRGFNAGLYATPIQLGTHP